jgi:hypothetical protein
MDRHRVVRLALLAAALALAVLFAGRLPKDHTVHYVLGDAAPYVEELDARWARQHAPASSGDPAAGEDWTREVSFRYAPGRAPRVVTHEPRLPDGDYTVEIEIVANSERKLVRRQVALGGGVAQIDLASPSGGERTSLPGGRR